MVDVERIESRLGMLEDLLERLERIHVAGEDAYLDDEGVRAMAERRLQLAIQACIDIGAQLAAELAVPPPADYAALFTGLAERGHLTSELGANLAAAARQRNLLVHAYMDVADRLIFASLSRLDDLREFAAAAQRLASADR